MLRRILTTALAAVALAGVTAVPAHADPNPPYTPTTIYVNGYAAGVFFNGLQINSTCEAHVEGLVAATVIEECRIVYEGYWPDQNHPGAAPGNAITSNFTQWVYTLDFALCFSAYTIPLHDPTVRVEYAGCAWNNIGGGLIATGGGSTTA